MWYRITIGVIALAVVGFIALVKAGGESTKPVTAQQSSSSEGSFKGLNLSK